jgi:hypothetical protein
LEIGEEVPEEGLAVLEMFDATEILG